LLSSISCSSPHWLWRPDVHNKSTLHQRIGQIERLAVSTKAQCGASGWPALRPVEGRQASGRALVRRHARNCAAGLALVQRPVEPGEEDPGSPRTIRLITTAFYDAWLTTWPDGSGLPLHDHGGSRSLTRVVDGQLVEIVTDLIDHLPPVASLLHRGDITCSGVSRVHDLANRSGADATTLHIYSPPLNDMTLYYLDKIDDSVGAAGCGGG
jgi:hypothetical protein